jgi:response regulator RpfG family c-di-GMP phosphodiesterase
VAKDIIVKESGSHFDPAVVAAFLAAEPSFVTIRDHFQDKQAAAA